MAHGRLCMKWLIVSAMVSVIYGLPTSSHEGPTSSTSTSRTDERGRQNLPERGQEITSTTPQPPSHSTPPNGDNDDTEDTEADAKLAAEVLHKYGYFHKGKSLHLQLKSPEASSHLRTERNAQSEAIRMFQSFFSLEQTGVLDKATVTLMKKDRCGVPDIPEEEVEERPHQLTKDTQSPSDFSLLGSKWDRNTLTWRLDVASNQLHPNEQRYIMKDAFATWGQVALLKFVEKRRGGNVDISVKFVRKRHGDSYPFDGKGKVLAHAFGPGEAKISGDMHMDDDEDWSNGRSDVYLVATHELGHSLGLGHSRDPSALMYPYYGLTDSLGPDDIKGIQSLYGTRKDPPDVTPRPTTTTTTTRKPITRFPWAKSATYTNRKKTENKPGSKCDVQFDTVIQDDPRHKDVYTGIRGGLVYRFNQKGLLAGYPSSLESLYPGAPHQADAVFSISEKFATYFIKGNRVWRYQGHHLDAAYPKNLDPSHFREIIRFVLPVVDTLGVQRIFVFGRTEWLEYDFDDLPAYDPHPHVIAQFWPDVTYDVRYAVTGFDGHIYLISPNSHVVLDSVLRRAVYGGKQEGTPRWLQAACHVNSGSSGFSSHHSFGTAFVVTIFSVLTYVLRK